MRRIAIVLLTCLSILLVGCKQNISDEWNSQDENAYFASTYALGDNICVHDEGVFYISSGVLSYYNYESEQAYILCSRPNCSHDESECVANAGNSAIGFAFHGGYAYYFRQVANSLKWELVRVDIKQQTTDVVCTLGENSISLDEWFLTGIRSVYYNQEYAWVSLHMLFNPSEPTGWTDNGTQLVSINLITGEMHTFTEPLMEGRDYAYIAWRYFGSDYVGYMISQYEPMYLNNKEYVESNQAANKPYHEYLSEFTETNSMKDAYWLINIYNMEQKALSTGYAVPQLIRASNEDKIFLSYDPTSNTECYYIVCGDDSSGSESALFTIQNGGALGWYHGEAGLRLYNDDSILYLIYDGENRCSVYRYLIDEEKSVFLFEDDASISFRIIGQTSNKLVGKINESSQLAWIYKEDYENGNFNAVHKFTLK